MSRFTFAIRRIVAVCTAGCVLAMLAQSAVAQAPPAGNAMTFKVQAAAERLEMTVNTSRILQLPYKVPRIFVGNPDIVKATPLSPNQIQVSALKPGVTQVNVWDEQDKISTIDLIVYGDARELEMLLRSEFPDAQLKIRPLASSLYLSGFVPKQEQVGQIVRMAEDFYPKVVNNLTVGGAQQILLNVKVMEVSRTKLRAMGIDWSVLNNNFFLTQHVGGLVSNIDSTSGLPVQLAQNVGADTVRFGVIGDTSFFGFLELLRQNELAKLMADPKLVTISGRPASFNVGGQVPIPVAQSLGTVTVEYKDFGTQIDFVPIALGNGNIHLEVRPEVTEVDPSLRDATTGVPGFRRRFADTAVEMKAGQTMAIAGLIYYRTDVSNKGVPWLADMPWIGAAFRRTRETSNEVELVITVTPEFVEAMDCEEVPACGPGQLTKSPTDVELYYRSYMEVPRCDGQCDVGGAGVSGSNYGSGGAMTGPGPLPTPAYQGAKTKPSPAMQQRSNQVANSATHSQPVQTQQVQRQPSPQPPSQQQPSPQPMVQQQPYGAPVQQPYAAPAQQPIRNRPTTSSATPVSIRREATPPSRNVTAPPAVGVKTNPAGTRAVLSDEPELIGPLGYDPIR